MKPGDERPGVPPLGAPTRRLGLVSATALVIGEVIGVGIFLTPSEMARSLGSPFWLLVVWGANHLHPAGGTDRLRLPGELLADAAGDRVQGRDGADPGAALHGQVAAPGQRLHHRDQRRDPDPLAGLLAVCALQPDLDHVEVRDPLARPPPLEPVEP